MFLTQSAQIDRRLLLDSAFRPEDFLRLQKQSMARSFADAILERYGDHIKNWVNNNTMNVKLSLELYIASRAELEEYVEYRIKKYKEEQSELPR